MQLFALPWLLVCQWMAIGITLVLITFCIVSIMWNHENGRRNTNEKNNYEGTFNAEAKVQQEHRALWTESPLPDPVPFPVVMPNRYLIDSNYNVARARKKFAETQKWRKEQGIDSLLSKERPFFHAVRSVYPHFLNGRSKQGNLVLYERPGFIDLKPAKATGLQVADVIEHFIFLQEFLWRLLDTREEDGAVFSVIDMAGVRFRDCFGDVFTFIKRVSYLYQAHYVERCERMMIVNAPSWISRLMHFLAPFCGDIAAARLQVVSAQETNSALLQYISSEQLPNVYGGKLYVPLDDGSINENKWPQSKEERILFDWVSRKCIGEDPNMENSNVEKTTTLMDQSKEEPLISHRINITPVQKKIILKKNNRIRLLVKRLTPKGRDKPTANRILRKKFHVWSLGFAHKNPDDITPNKRPRKLQRPSFLRGSTTHTQHRTRKSIQKKSLCIENNHEVESM